MIWIAIILLRKIIAMTMNAWIATQMLAHLLAMTAQWIAKAPTSTKESLSKIYNSPTSLNSPKKRIQNL